MSIERRPRNRFAFVGLDEQVDRLARAQAAGRPVQEGSLRRKLEADPPRRRCQHRVARREVGTRICDLLRRRLPEWFLKGIRGRGIEDDHAQALALCLANQIACRRRERGE